MGSGGRGKNAFKFIGPPGFEFLCEAQIQSIVERVTRMGGAGLRGPTLDPHKTTLLEDSGLFDRKELSAHCPECSQLRETGITGFLGDWLGTADYNRRRRTNANPPKPTARSERAEGSGIPPVSGTFKLTTLNPVA